MNEDKSIQPTPQLPASVPSTPPVAKPVYEVDDRERILLALCLCLGLLEADLLLSTGWNFLGLGIPVGVAAWYGVLLWYVGPGKLVESHTRLLFGAIMLLSLTFAFFSNGWFRFWNVCALLVLLMVHAFQLSGAGNKPWYMPSMLWERFTLLMDGLFGRLGALGAVVRFRKPSGASARRAMMAGVGMLVTLPVLLVAGALLTEADMVFNKIISDFFRLDFLTQPLEDVAGRIILGLLFTPFLFSLLYALGRPKKVEKKEKERTWSLDSMVSFMVLAGLDTLYLFFVGVQSAALFGGEAYLSNMDISYAEYARSGFFQLVFVTVLNLVVVLTLLQLANRTGKGWKVVQILSTALAALSGVILVSAAWRMTLYVQAYGLSFKRVLTYWGMIMITLFLVAVCFKVWKANFRFFQFAAVAALGGWLVLNYANVDRIVAEYNVSRYVNGSLEQVDLYYLSSLSYEALPVLQELDGEMVLQGIEWDSVTINNYLTIRKNEAVDERSNWETWSIPAWEWTLGWDG